MASCSYHNSEITFGRTPPNSREFHRFGRTVGFVGPGLLRPDDPEAPVVLVLLDDLVAEALVRAAGNAALLVKHRKDPHRLHLVRKRALS